MSASPASEPPAGDQRFALLDSLRGLAALSVVAYHVAFFSGDLASGWRGALLSQLDLGVTLFFLISGFVLYRPMVRARRAGQPPQRLRHYVRKRALRIVPAYWLALTVLAVYPGLTGVFGDRWWVYYGFGQVYGPSTILSGIWPAWSLGTEVAFYAVLPLLAAVLAHRDARAQVLVLGVLAAASVGFRAVVQARAGAPNLAQTLPGTFAWFALGMALAAVHATSAAPRALALVRARPLACWGAALGLFGVLAAVGGPERPFLDARRDSIAEAVAVFVLSGLVALLVLAPAVLAQEAHGPRRLLAHPALVWLGTVSYGIYLWHYPIAQRVAVGPSMELRTGGSAWRIAAVAVPVTIACAAVSYYALERPLLRLKRRRRDPAAA